MMFPAKKRDPVTKTIIKELLASEDIDEYTFVWRKGLEKWKQLDETEMSELLESERPPKLTGYNIFRFLLGRIFNLTFFFFIAFAVFIIFVFYYALKFFFFGIKDDEGNDL